MLMLLGFFLVYGCRAARRLQGALGHLCRPDPVRDQQEEYYRLGKHSYLNYVIAFAQSQTSGIVWYFWCFLFPVQIGTGHPRPSSEDDMESPFPKELTLQQVHQHQCQKILKAPIIR